MRTIELFAGTRSFSRVAKELGHKTFTTDYEEIDGQDLVADVRTLKAHDFPYCPDILWASPPCEGFSVAAIGKNWTHENEPKTDSARLSVELAENAMRLIYELNPMYWFIENPRGKLRKLQFMEDFLKRAGGVRHTVWYCTYGDTRAKPTDIWTNALWWKPRPMCWNGNKACHHEPAPRGARTGTQGVNGYKDRSRIPRELFEEIFEQYSNNN